VYYNLYTVPQHTAGRLQPSDVLQNVTGMTELPEEGVDERRNVSEC